MIIGMQVMIVPQLVFFDGEQIQNELGGASPTPEKRTKDK